MSTNTSNEKIQLDVGDIAPPFDLVDDTGKNVSLNDYAGKKVIVYFYPRANTPGCTKEACDFQENLSLLKNAGINIVAISPDKPAKLADFRKTYNLDFPLLSDPDKQIMRKWGAFGEKKNYGRIVQGVIRSTFLINEEGRIVVAKYNVRATGHVARLIKELHIS